MLLDTHVLLWLLADDARLGSETRSLIADAGSVHVSAASIWEIAIKAELGKLTVPDDLLTRIREAGLAWLPVTSDHAWVVRGVEGLPHRDPFDRLLIAQCGATKLALVTADEVLLGASLTPEVQVLDARN